MSKTSSLKKLVSAKRSFQERSGVHLWHSYYAGYSEAFVASAIEYLGLNKSQLLLDPWHGSGTTALVASRFEISTIGCEINPVMNIFATAKSSFLLEQIKLIKEILKDLSEKVIQFLSENFQEDLLLDFMSASLIKGVRTLYEIIDSYNYPQLSIASNLWQFLKEDQTFLNPFEAFFKAALFITARKLAGYKGGSNPTWVKTLLNKPEYDIKNVVSELSQTVDWMIQSLNLSFIRRSDTILHLALEADSRRLIIHDSSIDGIITSPPYLTL